MSAYRYLVFPQGKQPSVGEVQELHDYSDDLAGRYAFGYERRSGALTVAFEAATFDHVFETNAGFQSLIHRWKLAGCELVDHLGFVKDSAALRPTEASHWHPSEDAAIGRVPSLEKIFLVKDLAAKEALARSSLQLQQTLERYDLIQRLGAWTPYLLIAVATIVTICVGTYAYLCLSDYGGERRQSTINRVVEDPMQETLAGETAPESPSE